jgi:hypothetical protein
MRIRKFLKKAKNFIIYFKNNLVKFFNLKFFQNIRCIFSNNLLKTVSCITTGI